MKDAEIETLKKEQVSQEEKLKRKQQMIKNMNDWLQEMENL